MNEKIETTGFLSYETREGIGIIRHRFGDIFNLAERLNRYCIAKIGVSKVPEKNQSAFVIYLLAIRIVETFEGIIILYERGMAAPGKMLIRPILESLFTLAAIQKDPSLVDIFYNNQEKAHIAMLKATTRWTSTELRKVAKERGFERLYLEKKGKLKSDPIETLKPYQ